MTTKQEGNLTLSRQTGSGLLRQRRKSAVTRIVMRRILIIEMVGIKCQATARATSIRTGMDRLML